MSKAYLYVNYRKHGLVEMKAFRDLQTASDHVTSFMRNQISDYVSSYPETLAAETLMFPYALKNPTLESLNKLTSKFDAWVGEISPVVLHQISEQELLSSKE